MNFIAFAVSIQSILLILSILCLGLMWIILIWITFSFDSSLLIGDSFINYVKRRKAFEKIKHMTPLIEKTYTEWIDYVDKYETLRKESMSSQHFRVYSLIHEIKDHNSEKEFMLNKIFTE